VPLSISSLASSKGELSFPWNLLLYGYKTIIPSPAGDSVLLLGKLESCTLRWCPRAVNPWFSITSLRWPAFTDHLPGSAGTRCMSLLSSPPSLSRIASCAWRLTVESKQAGLLELWHRPLLLSLASSKGEPLRSRGIVCGTGIARSSLFTCRRFLQLASWAWRSTVDWLSKHLRADRTIWLKPPSSVDVRTSSVWTGLEFRFFILDLGQCYFCGIRSSSRTSIYQRWKREPC
jgi:hypothetical protein